MNKKVIFLKPSLSKAGQNIVRDFVYGCWCNGKRIGGMQMPPLNELYAATHCRMDGINVELLDAQIEPQRYLENINNGFKDTIAVIIMSSTQSFRKDVEIFDKIKNLNSSVKTILFGSHPTFMPEFCLKKKAVDFIVLREPEDTLKELIAAIRDQSDVKNVKGIGYRGNGNEFIINEPRPFMNMDNLPIPDRSLLPVGADYFNPVVKKLPYTTMQTSRGCPGKCIFCTAPKFYGDKTRIRSAGNVIDELRVVKKLGYKEIFFRDETFSAYKKRNIEICNAMLNENMNFSWIANGRVDMIDKEQMLIMKKAGCHLLKFGVESGVDKILKNYKKDITSEQTEQAFRYARDAGLDTHAHIVFGGPGETPETLDATIEFAKKIKASTASFGILTPYAGTELFDTVASIHPEIKDGSGSNLDNLHTQGFYSDTICGMTGDELHKYIIKAYRNFYLRPSYLVGKFLSIRSFEELVILSIAGLNIFQFAATGEK